MNSSTSTPEYRPLVTRVGDSEEHNVIHPPERGEFLPVPRWDVVAIDGTSYLEWHWFEDEARATAAFDAAVKAGIRMDRTPDVKAYAVTVNGDGRIVRRLTRYRMGPWVHGHVPELDEVDPELMAVIVREPNAVLVARPIGGFGLLFLPPDINRPAWF